MFDMERGIYMISTKDVEQRLLWQSAWLMFLVAVSGTVMGVVTGSSAVLLDGVVSFMAVIIKIMMIMTSKLISRETSKRFQFGYWQFEPLVLMVEGFFTLLFVLYAFMTGVIDILGQGHSVESGPIVVYAAFFTIVDSAYYFYVHHINKRLKSNLVKFDNISWSIDAVLAAGILISFSFAWALEQTDWAPYARYVDSVVLIALSVQMMPSAIKILVPATKQVLGVAPTELHERIQRIMDDFMARYHFKDYVSSVQVYGKSKFIEIDILLPKNFEAQRVEDMDKIRNEIDNEIGGRSDEKWLTITFTTTKRWMAKDYLLDDDDDE